MKVHPSETDLALLAGGDCNSVSQFVLNRHIRQCAECERKVAAFERLRVKLLGEKPARKESWREDLPGLDWNKLAAEMRANIHLGLEAGECVRTPRAAWRWGAGQWNPLRWNPRLAVVCGSLIFLIGADLLLRNPPAEPNARDQVSAPVLESTGVGLQLRTGPSSLTLLNRNGAVADQTVSAQGEIRARYIDRETGAVTINNVYLE